MYWKVLVVFQGCGISYESEEMTKTQRFCFSGALEKSSVHMENNVGCAWQILYFWLLHLSLSFFPSSYFYPSALFICNNNETSD